MSDWRRDALRVQPYLQSLKADAKSGFVVPSVLRAFQLDGQALEKEGASILRATFSSALSYLNTSLPYQYEEEIELMINLVLFKYGMWDRNQHYGDLLQNVVYRDERRAVSMGLESVLHSHPDTRPSAPQKLAKCVLTLIIPYLIEKLQRRVLDEDWGQEPENTVKHKVAILLNYYSSASSLAEFLNLIAFVRFGTYRSVVDRVLGLRLVHGRQRMMRVVNLTFLIQQLFYNTLFSVMSYLLPLLKLGRVWRLMTGFRGTASRRVHPSNVDGGATGQCLLCNAETITLPRRTSCGHCMCYYCIASRTANGATFDCPHCGHTIGAGDFTVPGEVPTPQSGGGGSTGISARSRLLQ